MRAVRALISLVIALVLVASAGAATLIVVRSGVLWADAVPGADRPVAAPANEAAPATDPVGLVNSLQVSQPRDPFRPLITEDSPVTELPGVGGVPGDGEGFTPVGTTITLTEIREVGGELRATIVVNGTSWDVGVGDTFAGSYRVVSLTEDTAVIQFGDTVFQLTVGQAILK